MAKSLNSFAFEDFFIRFKEAATNVGIPGLPKDVHLSISHHPNSPDINLSGCTDLVNQPSVQWRLWQANQEFARHQAGPPQAGLLASPNAFFVYYSLQQAVFDRKQT
ncbi:hypothetical protein [Mucilaginibacter sp.]|uniref:hypothetical protein n=1 Tax=Mucilaginibacter sp. TaxID=1882438 RepID=UPI002622C3E1|nr:hypothetical protein [Mucilaginibacter sp.]MDB4921818.1 hypothetical protein [Mucilaginibacter sp.]